MTQIDICRSTCEYNEYDYCIWCGRHLTEISRWFEMTDFEALKRIDSLKNRDLNKPFDPKDAEPILEEAE